MKIGSKEELAKRRKGLQAEVSRKDWFNIIINEIENLKQIYSDPRIKGYIRDIHEKTIKEYISTYLEDPALKESAKYNLTKIKIEGERERIKGIENNLKNLELILKKEEVSLKIKEKLINSAKEEIDSQIPEDLRDIYVEITSNMREEYLIK